MPARYSTCKWLQKIEENAMEDFFGLSDCNAQKNSESAYILFYHARE